MSPEITDKEHIRSYIKEKRRELTAAEKEEKSRRAEANVVCLLKRLKKETNFSWLYCYMDLKKETGTKGIISWCIENGIQIAVPRISGKSMDFFTITSSCDCKPCAMGILEPKSDCPEAGEASNGLSKTCPIIVPGVAFGRDGTRTGYGGGYYDRFFEKEPGHTAVGYCFDFQLYPYVPSESHDKGMDFIVTENRILTTQDKKCNHSEDRLKQI